MDTSLAKAKYNISQAVDHEIQKDSEYIRVSKYRHNALVPIISSLPHEILALIFSFLSPSARNKRKSYRSLLRVTHVCRHWRDTALSYPHLWSHINITRLTGNGINGILARAKMAPLHLEAVVRVHYERDAESDFFERQLEAHISRVHHLSLSVVSGSFQTVLERFISSAPALESLSLSTISPPYPPRHPFQVLPDALLNSTALKLTSFELCCYNVSWKSPFLKGLRTLEILRPSEEERPTLEDWLDALNEMPQLEALALHHATPICSIVHLISGPRRAVTLPSLTRFEIKAYVFDCALALAHLVLPALASLRVDAKCHERKGNDIGLLIPYVARNAHGPQDAAPLQSIVIQGEKSQVKIFVWTIPDTGIEDCDRVTMRRLARMVFIARNSEWHKETHTGILDSLLTHLPMGTISTLAVQDPTRLSKEFLSRHASSWVMLEQVHLDHPTTIKAFRETLAEDPPPNGPRLPRLRKLVLRGVWLTALGTYRLRDILRQRMEQGAPLENLDIRTCDTADRAIKLLAEVVGDVQGPEETWETGPQEHFNWKGGVEFFSEAEVHFEDVHNDDVSDSESGYSGRDSDEEETDDDDDDDDDDDEDDED